MPAILMSRTYPKVIGWEQANESKQWYNRTGRMEFYRDEDEFIEYGENLPVHREAVDADPEDRPYHGEKKPGSEEYRLARLMLRARYYYGTPRRVTRSWYNMYGATYGSVEGHLNSPDGLAKNPRTGYQAMFRFGSHQSATRGWLRPTLMTDSMVRKDTIGQVVGKGFAPDVHCPNGAPRESFVKFTKAEDGGIGGDKLWRPAKLGLRPTYESDAMKRFLIGGYVT